MKRIVNEPSLVKDPANGAVLLQDSIMYRDYMSNIIEIEENKVRLANLELSVLELNDSVLSLSELIKELLKK